MLVVCFSCQLLHVSELNHETVQCIQYTHFVISPTLSEWLFGDISDMIACVQCLCILDFFCTILRLEYVWQLYSTVVEEAWGSSFTVLLQCNCTHFLPGAVKGVWSNLLFLLQVQTKNPLRQPRDVRAFPLWLEQSCYVGTENHIRKVVNAKI